VSVTSPFLRFPDVQRVLVADLETLAGVNHTGTETPEDLAGALPYIRVLRVGGGSDRLNDYATVDVDCFAATYTAAEQLAERVRQRLVGPPPPIAVLDRATCEVGPRELPWGDGQIRRFAATFQIAARRHLSV
jgi:hypothetical protein